MRATPELCALRLEKGHSQIFGHFLFSFHSESICEQVRVYCSAFLTQKNAFLDALCLPMRNLLVESCLTRGRQTAAAAAWKVPAIPGWFMEPNLAPNIPRGINHALLLHVFSFLMALFTHSCYSVFLVAHGAESWFGKLISARAKGANRSRQPLKFNCSLALEKIILICAFRKLALWRWIQSAVSFVRGLRNSEKEKPWKTLTAAQVALILNILWKT
jgi:hypothetical protein